MADQGFLGKGWGFPPQFEANGKMVHMVESQEDIEQALVILLTTALKERLNRPNFGCDLNKYMFEEIDADLVMEVQSMIEVAIGEFESRVEVIAIEVKESEKTARLLLIQLDYRIKETNSVQNLVYPYYLF